jgi:hypothetical protein
VEILESRTLLNNRFVVPVGVPADNQTTFTTLQAALTTPGLASGDTIQIKPGSAPGNLKNADLPSLTNLTILGDPAAALAAIPQFNITDPVVIAAGRAGFTLKGVNVGLVTAGSLIFTANGTIVGSAVTDIGSSAANAITFAGTSDLLKESVLTNNAPLPSGSSLVLVTPPAGSNNLITQNSFVANAPSDALLIYQAAAAVTVTDMVTTNSFLANPGSNLAELLWVGEPVNPATPSGPIAGLTVQGNTFTASDADVAGIELNQTGLGTTVNGNVINLGGTSILNRGIVVVAGGAGTTTTAGVFNNLINTNGSGTGLEVDLGSAATSVVNLDVHGNDFHGNRAGVLIQPASGTSAAPLAGIDLGGGSQHSVGGNNFRTFNAAGTATSGAIVLSNIAAGQGTVSAQRNIFANNVTPRNVVWDPNNQVDLTNTLTPIAAFVQTVYEQFLHRAGDTTNPSDAGGWVSFLAPDVGGTPAGAVNAIAHSPEALGILVNGLFLKLLGRPVDPPSQSAFVSFLQHGGTLEQAALIIIGSPEYAGPAVSDAAFIESLYSKVVGRVASPSEVNSWLNVLPALGRDGVAGFFVTSPEFRTNAVQQLYGFTPAAPVSVASLLPNLLHRSAAPPAAEVKGWVTSGLDLLGLAVGIASSPEYFAGGNLVPQVVAPAGLPQLHRHAPLVSQLAGEGFSTVPPTGPADVNPYGVAFVPPTFPTTGTLQPGDLLVANFNDPANVQGTGTTITRVTPQGERSTFFTSILPGLDTALAVLKAGFVIVGNVPNAAGAPAPGALQILNANGMVVQTLTDPALLKDPWDLTVNDQGNMVQVFVSNVSGVTGANGTVTRIDLQIVGGTVTVADKVQIASGYATRLDAAAFVVGPGGLAYDAGKNVLYVASEVEKVGGVEVGTVFAIPNAGTATTDNGKGNVVYADAAHLHGPIGLVLLPNGDLLTANSDAVNTDPNQPSELVEFTTAGTFVNQFSIDPLNGGAFGLNFTSSGGQIRFAAVNDNQVTVTVWNFIPTFGNPYVVSTVPPTGPADVNPYGVAFVPPTFPTVGTLQPGDLLVANFNDPANVQGTGTTITRVTPQGERSTFFTSALPGLDTALAVLKAGFVIVGNVPNNGTGGVLPGALQILNANGMVVQTLTDPALLADPWDLTVNDQGNLVQVFVSNVSGTAGPNGTVTRIDLQIAGATVTVADKVQIASGYATRLDPAAFVIGPGGLAYDPRTDTLYVAAQDELVGGVEVGSVFAIPNAGRTAGDHGKGNLVYADAAHLHSPIGLVLLPNGDLLTANSDAVNTDPNQPSELVEFTPTGTFVNQFSIDPLNGGAFGLNFISSGGQLRFAALNDNQVTASFWSFQTGIDFPATPPFTLAF